jgi:hypothetical protein
MIQQDDQEREEKRDKIFFGNHMKGIEGIFFVPSNLTFVFGNEIIFF